MTIPSALVSLDSESFDHKPSSKLQYRDEVNKFGEPKTEVRVLGARLGGSIANVTPKSLAKAICFGQTWSPYVFNECPQWRRPRRVEGLFKSTQVVALDFDKNESLDYIEEEAKKWGFNFNIIHHSFSSTEAHRKLRAIAFLESPVEDFNKARLYASGLVNAFEADSQCIDAARLYFGSKPDSIIHLDNESVISLSVLEKIAEETGSSAQSIKSELNISKPDNTEWGDAKTQRQILSGLTPSKRNYVQKKALGILKDVKEFNGTKGSRYECVWRSTSRLARMPELVGSAVFEWVLDAIANNPHFVDWDKNPEQVILSAIEWSSDHADEPV